MDWISSGKFQACTSNNQVTFLERLLKSVQQLQDLQSNLSVVEKENEVIKPVSQELKIKDGTFILNDFQATKDTLKVSKSCGEDGIVWDLQKSVLVDALVLYVANKAFELAQHLTIHSIRIILKSGDLTKTTTQQ